MDADLTLSAAMLRKKIGQVTTGVILGSGLGAAADEVASNGGIVIPYREIPQMPEPLVPSHQGRMVIGTGALEGTVLLQGRVHLYEGHSVPQLTFGARLLARLGMKKLIVSNAAGGISPEYRPGDLMLINGHWTHCHVQEPPIPNSSLAIASSSTQQALPKPSDSKSEAFQHPEVFRRTEVSNGLWNRGMLQIASSVPSPLDIHVGTYAMMSGPNYETPAEIRMLRSLNCQAVGMSTIPEAIAAARRGVDVLGISCITNIAAGLSDQPLDHNEVSHTAGTIETEFVSWLFRLIAAIQTDETDLSLR